MIAWGLGTSSFVTATVALVPWLSFLSRRRIVRGGAQMPGRRSIFAQTMVIHAALGVLALRAAWENDLSLFPPPKLEVAGLGAAALWLAAVLGTLPLRWSFRSVDHKRRLLALLPATPGERALWVGLCISAGVWEEIVYRGALFALACRLTGNWWPAALACSAVFGLSHLVQGWKSAGLIVAIALGLHVVVRLTGGLYVAMAIHALYDFVAGLWLGRMGRDDPRLSPAREGRPAAA